MNSDIGFTIYESFSPYPQYEKNSQWNNFVQTGTLDKKLLTDQDIENYDWNNQVIFLKKEIKTSKSRTAIIAALGKKRLYGGELINHFSAMAIKHPVIYQSTLKGRPVLIIRTRHDFVSAYESPDFKSLEWKELGSDQLKLHFSEQNKLILNSVENIFQAMDTNKKVKIDVNSLAKAFKSHLEKLTEAEKSEIPVQYRTKLLFYLENAELSEKAIGSWYLEDVGSNIKMTNWQIMSDETRIGAQTFASYENNRWSFQKLKLIRVNRKYP